MIMKELKIKKKTIKVLISIIFKIISRQLLMSFKMAKRTFPSAHCTPVERKLQPLKKITCTTNSSHPLIGSTTDNLHFPAKLGPKTSPAHATGDFPWLSVKENKDPPV